MSAEKAIKTRLSTSTRFMFRRGIKRLAESLEPRESIEFAAPASQYLRRFELFNPKVLMPGTIVFLAAWFALEELVGLDWIVAAVAAICASVPVDSAFRRRRQRRTSRIDLGLIALSDKRVLAVSSYGDLIHEIPLEEIRDVQADDSGASRRKILTIVTDQGPMAFRLMNDSPKRSASRALRELEAQLQPAV